MHVQAFKLKTLTVISSCVIYELPAAFIEVRFFIFWKEKEVKHKILIFGIMLLCIVGVKAFYRIFRQVFTFLLCSVNDLAKL